MVTVFRSKIDGKLIAVGLIMPCVALAAIAASPRPAVLWVPAMAIVVATIVVVWVILFDLL